MNSYRRFLAAMRGELPDRVPVACWLGLPFLPAYAVASAWSWARTGDPWSRNAFERRAGLAAGGYREARPRPLLRRR